MTDDAAYAACARRDATLDGRLFLAVSTTRIFCRPSCPARMPKREHARFYATAAGAQAAGHRPAAAAGRPMGEPPARM